MAADLVIAGLSGPRSSLLINSFAGKVRVPVPMPMPTPMRMTMGGVVIYLVGEVLLGRPALPGYRL